MISKQDCHILNSCHRDYIGHGVSPYDASSGVLVGRPYGGVGFMWKNSLDECDTIVHCDYDWMCCIKLSSANKDMYIINVYLPYECMDNHDMYMDYLSKIAVFTAGINSTCIFIVGDFNADLSKRSPFGSILCDFCHDNSFTIADKEYLPADTYSYVSSAWGTTSWLDHIVCTADAMSCVSKMEILYNCIHSDHHPVLFRLDCDVVPEYNTCAEQGSTLTLKSWRPWGSQNIISRSPK